MDDSARHPLLDSLDEDQREVAQQLRGPVAVIAGPGSGKTRVISHRIAYGVAMGVYDPAKVLALTYTNKAAAELRTRMRALGVPGVSVRTFHAAALSQLQFFWPQLTGAQAPRLAPSKLALLREAAESQRIRLDQDQFFAIQSRLEYYRYTLTDPSDDNFVPIGTVQFEQFLALSDSYQALKRDRKLIDWEDAVSLAAGMFRSEPQLLEQFRQQYRFFTVDEYQDISALQQALLETWLDDREDVCVVGDPRQTIYSFAGANPEFLMRFSDRFPAADVFELNRNYRSSIEIVEYANRILGPDQVAQRTLSSRPRFVEYPTVSAEAQAISLRVSALLREGVEPGEIAVLVRSNHQIEAIENELTEQGIPTLVRGAGRFFAKPEVVQAMHALRALTVTDLEKPTFAAVSDVLRSLGWRTEGSGESWESLNWFITVLDELGGNPAVADYVRELQERERSGHEPARNAVTLATIHSTKGLEWRCVFVASVSDSVFPPSRSAQEQFAEERRLFFVAVTRAQELLEISFSSDRGRSPLLGSHS
jgi:DNA helicase-2/ATP-dependent DNA helicase PcrA